MKTSTKFLIVLDIEGKRYLSIKPEYRDGGPRACCDTPWEFTMNEDQAHRFTTKEAAQARARALQIDGVCAILEEE